MVTKLDKLPSLFSSFLQALGLTIYILAIASFLWKAESWFGPMNRYLGPVLILTLLTISVLVCGFLALGYPAWLVWEKKKTKKALKNVAYTLFWLFTFFLGTLTITAFI